MSTATWFPRTDTHGNRHPLGIGTLVQDGSGLILANSITWPEACKRGIGVQQADHDLPVTIDYEGH